METLNGPLDSILRLPDVCFRISLPQRTPPSTRFQCPGSSSGWMPIFRRPLRSMGPTSWNGATGAETGMSSIKSAESDPLPARLATVPVSSSLTETPRSTQTRTWPTPTTPSFRSPDRLLLLALTVEDSFPVPRVIGFWDMGYANTIPTEEPMATDFEGWVKSAIRISVAIACPRCLHQ